MPSISRRMARGALLALVLVLPLVWGRLVAAAPPAQATSCGWTKLANGDTRSQFGFVGIPGRGAVSFGGLEYSTGGKVDISDDLYLLDMSEAGGSWVRMTASGTSPGKRAEQATTYRGTPSGGKMMVTIGGVDSVPSGGTATWLSPLLGGGPAGLAPAKVRNDAAGLTVSTSGFGGGWSRLGTTSGGEARADHTAVWFPDDDAAIIFGGRKDENANSAQNNTWRLQLEGPHAWEELKTGGTPPSRRFAHTAVYDPVAKRMIVFGGTDDWTSGMNDSWALDLSQGWDKATWSRLTTGGTAPTARFDHAAVYLPDLQWMLVFAGTRDGKSQLGDLNALDLSASPPQWLKPTVTGTKPADVYGLGGTNGEAGNTALFYGGQTGGGNGRVSRREAWQLSCTAATPPTATPTSGPTEPTATATEAPPTVTPTQAITDVTVTGLVFDQAGGQTQPIAGAVVRVSLSVPHQPFEATTGADGRYSLLVPAAYVPMVNRIEVSAAGYEPVSQAVTGAELAAQSVRDFGLVAAVPTATPSPTPTEPPTVTPEPTRYFAYMPITLKGQDFPPR